jgi:hypothetical protein
VTVRLLIVFVGGRASRPPLPGILPGRTAPDETSGAGERDARPPIGLISMRVEESA